MAFRQLIRPTIKTLTLLQQRMTTIAVCINRSGSLTRTWVFPSKHWLNFAFRLSQSAITRDPSLTSILSNAKFESICDETLQSLADRFDDIADSAAGDDFDVSYSSGVLTVKLGNGQGTYVINKQTPNKQIWLSSPYSGPKRYDFVLGQWIYKRDGLSLHQVLDKELSPVFKHLVFDFTTCEFGCSQKLEN